MTSDCNPADVTFCFLVTRDLSKEHIWREWFECLARLQFKCAIVVHCSNKDSIHSEWLKQHLIPDERRRKTAWGWVLNAISTCPKRMNISTPCCKPLRKGTRPKRVMQPS